MSRKPERRRQLVAPEEWAEAYREAGKRIGKIKFCQDCPFARDDPYVSGKARCGHLRVYGRAPHVFDIDVFAFPSDECPLKQKRVSPLTKGAEEYERKGAR